MATQILVEKKKDLRALTILCTIGSFKFAQALYDFRSRIILMPLVVYRNLGFGAPKLISIRLLLMTDRLVKKLFGILCDVFVKDASFIF